MKKKKVKVTQEFRSIIFEGTPINSTDHGKI